MITRIIALLLLIFISPLLILISIIILIEDGFPIIYKQINLGKNHKTFTLFKFRTMLKNTPLLPTEEMNDSNKYLLKCGHFLRKYSLDELPQFFNVFFGDMSIVGPRPEMKFIVKNYNEFELLRLKIKPGLTGTWQVSDTRNAPIHHNLDYDLHQIMYYSFSYNMKQIINTILWATKGF